MTDKPKEKSKELSEEELAVKASEISSKYLKSSLWDYAAPKLITPAQYGSLAESANDFYLDAVSKVPSKEVYEGLFLPQLAREGGAVTSPYLQNTSVALLQESLFNLKVEDAVKYFGYKGSLKPEYAGKYVNQLDKKEAGLIVGSAIQFKTDEIIKKVLELRQKQIPKNLEQILGVKPEAEK